MHIDIVSAKTTIKITDDIAKHLCNSEGCSIDPITVLIIINIVIEVVKLINECQEEDTNEVKKLNKPSKLEKRILKRIVRKELGFFRYWFYGNSYLNALEKTGQKITKQELQELYKENGFQS